MGINWAVKQRLEADYKQWPGIWEEYLASVLEHPEAERMEWRHVSITGKALLALMEEFEDQLCAILTPLFPRLALKPRALLYDSFLYAETTENTRCVFVRETIEDLLAPALDFIAARHDSPQRTRDGALLEKALVGNLAGLL